MTRETTRETMRGGAWLRKLMDDAGTNPTALAKQLAGPEAGYNEVERLRRKINRYRNKDEDWFLIDVVRALGVTLERAGKPVELADEPTSLSAATARIEAVATDLREIVEALRPDPAGESGPSAAERGP